MRLPFFGPIFVPFGVDEYVMGMFRADYGPLYVRCPHFLHFVISFPASLDRNNVSPGILKPCNSTGFGCVYLDGAHPERRHIENERQPNSERHRPLITGD